MGAGRNGFGHVEFLKCDERQHCDELNVFRESNCREPADPV